MIKNGPFNTFTPEQIAEMLRNSGVGDYIIQDVMETIKAQRQDAFETGLTEVDNLMN